MLRRSLWRILANRPSVFLIKRCSSDLATGRVDLTESNGEDVLTDKYGRKHTYLRISLTERCNLRCELMACADKLCKVVNRSILYA